MGHECWRQPLAMLTASTGARRGFDRDCSTGCMQNENSPQLPFAARHRHSQNGMLSAARQIFLLQREFAVQ